MDGAVKVYRLNDYDWWAGTNMDDVVATYLGETGQEAEDALDDRDTPRELTPQDMEVTDYIDCGDLTGREDERITFAEALRLMLEQGRGSDGKPFFFASTEY